ncbi:hypothetical protein [Kitasatospora sp. NPDC056184]
MRRARHNGGTTLTTAEADTTAFLDITLTAEGEEDAPAHATAVYALA